MTTNFTRTKKIIALPGKRKPAAELAGPLLALLLLALAGWRELREPPRKREIIPPPDLCAEPESQTPEPANREPGNAPRKQETKDLNSCPENLRFILGMPMNLNRVSEQDLELIPGIGPKKAALIIEARTRGKGFSSVEELEDLPGLTPRDLQLLRAYTRVENHASKP